MHVLYVFNGKVLSNEKNKVLRNVTHWVNLKIIMVQWGKIRHKRVCSTLFHLFKLLENKN